MVCDDTFWARHVTLEQMPHTRLLSFIDTPCFIYILKILSTGTCLIFKYDHCSSNFLVTDASGLCLFVRNVNAECSQAAKDEKWFGCIAKNVQPYPWGQHLHLCYLCERWVLLCKFFSTAFSQLSARDLSAETNRIRTETFYELQYFKCMLKTEWELGEAI